MIRRLRADDGSILPLVIVFGMLSLVVVLLAVSATSLYLERKRLFTLADGAALAGAEAFSLADARSGDGTLAPQLRSSDVADAVDAYVADAPAEFDSLGIDRAESVDGRSATVTLSADWSPPVFSLLVPAGFRIEVTAVGRSVFF
jgi:uncharacterized membrane protein